MNLVLYVAICMIITQQSTASRIKPVKPLYVLSLLPYSDSNGAHGWDHGLELLPAARVAVKHINNRTDILPGYEIRLIERASDACGRTVITKNLYNLVGTASKYYNNPIAVVGLVCSTGTAAVSPIADRFGIFQLVMANSKTLRDKERFHHSWRFISSSEELVKAAVALMERYDWHRVGIISNENGVFFRALAVDFKRIVELKNFTLARAETINSNQLIIESAIESLRSLGIRIIFMAVTIPQSIEIICEASRRNLVWPGYAWMIPSSHYNDLISNHNTTRSKGCKTREDFVTALNNLILVNFELNGRSDNVPMVSGKAYSQYRADYDNEYKNIQRQYNGTGIEFSSTYNVYANPMYDELWALALALNSSLEKLEENGSFNIDNGEDHWNMSKLTEIVERNIKNVSFSGTLSRVVHFNEFQEVPTSVNIIQIKERLPIHIAQYKEGNLTILYNDDEATIPGDDFVLKFNSVKVYFVIELFINACLLTCFTSILLVIVILFRKEPEVLAISPLLTILIFIGCYQLILVSVLSVSRNYFTLSRSLYITSCYLEIWSAQSGVNFIATTMLVRVVRIYRVFTHFGKTGSIWKDRNLFLVIMLLWVCPVVILIIGYALDPLQLINQEQFIVTENPPIQLVMWECNTGDGFSNISYITDQIYTAVLVILLLAFGLLTRKVNKKNFKDTKKIMTFILVFTLIAILSPILYHVLKSTGRGNAAIVLISHSHQLITMLSLSVLIAPKAIPAFYYRVVKKRPRKSYRSQQSKENKTNDIGLTILVAAVFKDKWLH